MSLESGRATAGRRNALTDGWRLYELAAKEQLVAIGDSGCSDLGRALARLQADGWITWHWQSVPGRKEYEPPPQLFDCQALQRVRDIRITPLGYTAHAASAGAGSGGEAVPDHSRADSPEGSGADTRDVFISHAGEDKAAFGRPLAEELRRRGRSVWFDEYELEIGDSLLHEINRGLRQSRVGIVILSHAFFAKKWPLRELEGLLALEVDAGPARALPVWHGLEEAEVADYAPLLAGRVAAKSSDGVVEVADRVERALAKRGGGLPSQQAPAREGTMTSNRDARRIATELQTIQKTASRALASGRWWSTRTHTLPSSAWQEHSDAWGDASSEELFERAVSIYTDADLLNKRTFDVRAQFGECSELANQDRDELGQLASDIESFRGDLLTTRQKPDDNEKSFQDRRSLVLALHEQARAFDALRHQLRGDPLGRTQWMDLAPQRARQEEIIRRVTSLLGKHDDLLQMFLAPIEESPLSSLGLTSSERDHIERELKIRTRRLTDIITALQSA